MREKKAVNDGIQEEIQDVMEENTGTTEGEPTYFSLCYYPRKGFLYGKSEDEYRFSIEERNEVLNRFMKAENKEKLKWELIGVNLAYIKNQTHEFFRRFGIPWSEDAFNDLLSDTVSVIASEVSKYDKGKAKMTVYLSFYIKEAQRKYIMKEIYPELSSHYYTMLVKIRQYIAENGIDPEDYPPSIIMDDVVNEVCQKYPKMKKASVRRVFLYMMSFPRSIEADMFGAGRQTFAEIVTDNKTDVEAEIQEKMVLTKFAYCLKAMENSEHYEIKRDYLQAIMHGEESQVNLFRKYGNLPEIKGLHTIKKICHKAVAEFRELWIKTSDDKVIRTVRKGERIRKKKEKMQEMAAVQEPMPEIIEDTYVSDSADFIPDTAEKLEDKIRAYARKEVEKFVEAKVSELIGTMDIEAMVREAVTKIVA